MNADIFYRSVPGRFLFQVLQKVGFFRLAAWFLHTRLSKRIIHGYVRKHGIDMKPYDGQSYGSFASFFSRKREDLKYVSDPNMLISPCDGLLSVYHVSEDLTIPMKGSAYVLTDLVPDKEIADLFHDGLCLVFRLEASDYHHFCCFDDASLVETNYVPGQLHSVQPIALRSFPVFRLNRRWWSVLETKHFGTAVQVEIGAMVVGGVSFSGGDSCRYDRGDDMGCFELAGSTIVLLLNSYIRKKLVLHKSLTPTIGGEKEIRVQLGSAIGALQNEK